MEVETRPLRGGGQQVIRRWLRHNAIAAWKRCRSQAGASDARLSGEESQLAVNSSLAPMKNPALRRGLLLRCLLFFFEHG